MKQKEIKEQEIPDLNIFMMCEKLNTKALSQIPKGFHIRNCKPEELKIWMEFPFDNEDDKKNSCDCDCVCSLPCADGVNGRGGGNHLWIEC